MLSASLVSRWCAPRVKGLRAALVLAKAARFAVLDRAATPPSDTAPHRAKCLAIKKACCFYGDSRPALRAGKSKKKHTQRREHEHRTVHSRRREDHGTELIAANIKALIEQLEAGNSDALTAYLDAMSRFHRYSFGNVLSLARQRPGATRVCGFHAWRQLGRNVKKGERGIRILAPIISKRRQRDDRDKDMPSRPMLAGFRNAYVLDVRQTDGAELPTIREIGGDVGELIPPYYPRQRTLS
jgi:hypothetical protein